MTRKPTLDDYRHAASVVRLCIPGLVDPHHDAPFLRLAADLCERVSNVQPSDDQWYRELLETLTRNAAAAYAQTAGRDLAQLQRELANTKAVYNMLCELVRDYCAVAKTGPLEEIAQRFNRMRGALPPNRE